MTTGKKIEKTEEPCNCCFSMSKANPKALGFDSPKSTGKKIEKTKEIKRERCKHIWRYDKETPFEYFPIPPTPGRRCIKCEIYESGGSFLRRLRKEKNDQNEFL